GVGGGVAEGGAIYAAGGTITMRDDNVTGNIAYGLYIAPTATVYLDAFTLANIVNNTAGDIYGSYTIIS
ncbi:MAG TPA: hypothetical protein VGX70_01385, partial [Gemmataceae bacterium]|nr:hypothetical protein [Gemmataceae bacterium]